MTMKTTKMNNLFLVVVPKGRFEDAITGKFNFDDDLELVLCAKSESGDMGAIKTRSVPATAVDDLWNVAAKNTQESGRFFALSDILGPAPIEGGIEIFVGSNDSNCLGAAAGFLGAKSFCKNLGWSGAWIIPSSIHEVLLVPDSLEREMLESMIYDINRSVVDESERLSDRAYHVTIG